MTAPDGWAAPDVPGPPPPGVDLYPPADVYPVATSEDADNWGVAVPGYATPGLVALVPRPPRPRVVSIAFGLAYGGVVLSGLYVIAYSIAIWLSRGRYLTQVAAAQPDVPVSPNVVNTSLVAALVIGLSSWLVAAAGTVACTVLAGRGHNPARIVLACLGGTFALNSLCGSVAGLFMASPLGAGRPETPWWGIAAQGLFGLMGVAILVLLLVPPAGRYFSPGPGRRFAPSDALVGALTQAPWGAGHMKSGR